MIKSISTSSCFPDNYWPKRPRIPHINFAHGQDFLPTGKEQAADLAEAREGLLDAAKANSLSVPPPSSIKHDYA